MYNICIYIQIILHIFIHTIYTYTYICINIYIYIYMGGTKLRVLVGRQVRGSKRENLASLDVLSASNVDFRVRWSILIQIAMTHSNYVACPICHVCLYRINTHDQAPQDWEIESPGKIRPSDQPKTKEVQQQDGWKTGRDGCQVARTEDPRLGEDVTPPF